MFGSRRDRDPRPAEPSSAARPRARDGTVVLRLEKGLVREILRGERPAGSHLPPVREMAKRFGVTGTTIQRVVARLESAGLVRVRRGSGIEVRDAGRFGDLALLPLWVDALGDRPAEAARRLGDLLELRRVAAAHLLEIHRDRIGALTAHLERVLERLEPLAQGDPGRFATAALETSREVVESTGHTAMLALCNTVEQVILESPAVAEAMYGQPERNLHTIRLLLDALAPGPEPPGLGLDGPEIHRRFTEIVAGEDDGTVRRFRAILEERP